MSLPVILLALLVLGIAGFFLGRRRALASVEGDARLLHSLPNYYGWNVALVTLIPSLVLLAVWLLVQPMVIDGQVSSMISQETADQSSRDLVMSDVRRTAHGLDLAVAQGAMSADMADSIRTEFTDVRNRLGEVGVALGWRERRRRRRCR